MIELYNCDAAELWNQPIFKDKVGGENGNCN